MSSGNLIVRIDGSKIHDEDSFHDLFYKTFGFPGWYGRNMNAWIDCMSYLDDKEAAMTSLHVEVGGMVALQIKNIKEMKERFPDVYNDLIECSAFVNWRRIEGGEDPVLALSFYQ